MQKDPYVSNVLKKLFEKSYASVIIPENEKQVME